jgi:formyltetrahydrofolate deformylase
MHFQRIVFANTARLATELRPDNSSSCSDEIEEVAGELEAIADKFGVTCELDWMQRPKRVAIMVSKSDHCLWELLLRHQANELMRCDIPIVISNHSVCQSIAEDTFGIPFAVFPMDSVNKAEQERKQLELLREYEIDVIVLARYMQVLSENFLSEYADRIINIHHSFLPAFSGGRAYHQAHERGVKLIGATVSIDQPCFAGDF